MKAKTRVTNKNRILSTTGLLILAITIGYGQGLLAESAMKLFKINQAVIETSAPEFTFADYAEKEDSFSFKNLFRDAFLSETDYETEANVSRTIMASSVEISFEADIEAEKWMTTPLSNNMENALAVETWMTKPLGTSIESDLLTEDWMTQSFSESLESELVVEDWMTVSLTESIEKELLVEDWMLVSFAK